MPPSSGLIGVDDLSFHSWFGLVSKNSNNEQKMVIRPTNLGISFNYFINDFVNICHIPFTTFLCTNTKTNHIHVDKSRFMQGLLS